MAADTKPWRWLLGLAGAAGGGVLGFFIFVWLANQGLIAVLLPGAALGIGGAVLMRKRSLAFGVVCAVFAMLLGFFSYWWIRLPLMEEESSFFYLLTHPNHLPSIILLMIGLGGLCAFWFGLGQEIKGD
jgi:hypothetical protein